MIDHQTSLQRVSSAVLAPGVSRERASDAAPGAPADVLNTEAFSVWQESFTKLKGVLHQAREANGEHRGWLM
jgi:hypothetical protein